MTNKQLDKFTYFDTETTGVDYKTDRLVSVYCENKNRGWYINTLTNPEMEIPTGATKVNGIDNSLVNNKPVNSKILTGLVKVFNDTNIICGYNILKFDMPLVISLCNKENIPINYKNYTYVDVYLLLKIALTSEDKQDIGSLSLSNVYKHIFKKDLVDAHNAKSDVIACKDILKWLNKNYEIDDIMYLNSEYILGEPVDYNYKFLTGKYENYTVKELLELDPNYLKFMKNKNHIVFIDEINLLL